MSKKDKKEALDLSRMDPFDVMSRVSKDMERLFMDLQDLQLPTSFAGDLWTVNREADGDCFPQVEVSERKGQLTVRVDLPGLTKDQIKVEVTENMLMVSGERKGEKEEQWGFFRSELHYGSFYRELPLPVGAMSEKAEATFVNGVLEVSMPLQKTAKARRRLEIKEPLEEEPAKAAA